MNSKVAGHKIYDEGGWNGSVVLYKFYTKQINREASVDVKAPKINYSLRLPLSKSSSQHPTFWMPVLACGNLDATKRVVGGSFLQWI
jgi:hypothetical protein